MKKTKTTHRKATSTLALHDLIAALSFWGTAVRTLLFGFLAGAIFLAALTEPGTARASIYITFSMFSPAANRWISSR